MKYKIPRNVKTGLSFMGLEWKGWLLFLPTILVFGGAVILLVPDIRAKVVLCILIVSISYFSFMVDESTGSMNYTAFTEFLEWRRSNKQIEPVWDDDFKYETLLIKKKIDNDTLIKYKSFLLTHNTGGDDSES